VAVASSSSLCVAPSDYAELFLEHGDLIRRTVRRQLGYRARPEDVEDGVTYILGQIMPDPARGRAGIIDQYNPRHVNDYNHKFTSFKAFLMNKVELYCRGIRKTNNRYMDHCLLTFDAPADDAGTSAGEVANATTDAYPSLAGEGMDYLREALSTWPDPEGLPPVLDLFDALALRDAEGRSVSAAAVRGQFGLSKEQADIWFAELQAALRDITTRPAPAPAPAEPEVTEPEPAAAEEVPAESGYELLPGVVLTAQEVRAAFKALEASCGNRVFPAFMESAHRLAGAGREWYLEFAEAVMRRFPALRSPKGGHFPGGHFGRVKNALIYGLRNLVGEAPDIEPLPAPAPPPPVPEPEETDPFVALGAAAYVTEGPPGEPDDPLTDAERARWDDLVAALAALPGFTDRDVGAAVEAVRSLAGAP
jgi:hypothetical protein